MMSLKCDCNVMSVVSQVVANEVGVCAKDQSKKSGYFNRGMGTSFKVDVL